MINLKSVLLNIGLVAATAASVFLTAEANKEAMKKEIREEISNQLSEKTNVEET